VEAVAADRHGHLEPFAPVEGLEQGVDEGLIQRGRGPDGRRQSRERM